MSRFWLVNLSFLGAALGLASCLEPWFQTWAGSRRDDANPLAVALGDSRRLFAKHIYAKADAYFHNGYYPSIFDYKSELQGNYLSQRIGLAEGGDPSDHPGTEGNTAAPDDHEDHDAHDGHEDHDGHEGHAEAEGHGEAEGREEHDASYLGPPLDWIDRFSRHFFPSRHTHLGEDPAEAGHEHHDHAPGEACPLEGKEGSAVREILPWLKFSAGLDPDRVETYVVAAYWLRRELGKPDQAEQFLREGLRRNPRNEEILFELGRIYQEDRRDAARARNVWELAVKSWRAHQSGLENPNIFLYAQLLGNLGKLEEEQGNYERAIQWLQSLAEVSPHRARIEEWIGEVRAKLEARAPAGAGA